MTNYGRGDYREKRAKKFLESLGFTVWQTRQSRGVADLVALARDQSPILAQVKINDYVPHNEWNGLYRLAVTLNARPMVVTCEGNSPHITMLWRLVTGEHTKYSSVWPARPMFREDG